MVKCSGQAAEAGRANTKRATNARFFIGGPQMVTRIAFDARTMLSHNPPKPKHDREVRKRWRLKKRVAKAAERASRLRFNQVPISRRSPATSPSRAAK